MRSSSVSQRFRTLVDAYCSDSIAPAELRELAAILRQDRHARRFFAAYCRMHAELLFSTLAEHAVHTAGTRQGDGPDFRANENETAPFGFRFWGSAWHVVAGARRVPLAGAMASLTQIVPISYLVTAVLLGVALAVAWRFPSAQPARPAVAALSPLSAHVGTITGLVDCRWGDPATAANYTAPVCAGRRFVLASGLLEITYNSGAEVILQGPAAYEVDAGGGFLSVGRLTARVEKKGADPARRAGLAAGAGVGPACRAGLGAVAGQASGDGRPFFAIRTPTAVLTSSRECSGRDIPSSTEFGVVVVSPEVSRAYVFRGRIAAQAPGGGRGDQAVPVDENQAVWVQQADEGRKATIVREEGRPNPNLFARREIVPLGGDLKQVAWLKDVGTGQQRHFVAVGSGEDLDLPSRSRLPSGTVSTSRLPGRTDDLRTPTGVTYTCRLAFELRDLAPSTAMLRARYFAYNYVTAIRLNGKNIAPSHRLEPRAVKEGGEFLSREAFVPGLNVLEIDVNNSGVSGSSDSGGVLWLRPELSGIRPPTSPLPSGEGPGVRASGEGPAAGPACRAGHGPAPAAEGARGTKASDQGSRPRPSPARQAGPTS